MFADNTQISRRYTNLPKNQIFNPNIDEHYFDVVDTEDKAYFIGLIISDGNVYDPCSDTHSTKHTGSKMVSITLKDEDEYMLESFSKAVGLSNKIAHDGRGSSTAYARSDIMANALEKYGIVPSKLFKTYFPLNIDERMYRHVLRGIIDGDGSIQFKKVTPPDGRPRYRHNISICGTHRLMSDIASIALKYLPLDKFPNVYDYKNKPLSEVKFANIHDMKAVGDWIYDGATIFLSRKHDKYVEFLNHYFGNCKDMAK